VMTCPRCRHETRPGARFCDQCGSPLGRRCGNCGVEVSATAKFCPECGQAVSAPSVLEVRFASPQGYTPKHLAEKILTSRDALEGERKQVTVLCADMKGSMELLADRDPEEARMLLDPVLERMMEAVHRYEGTVNQVMGDGIMALFGAPLAHEDHAVRACYAALGMQDAIARYNDGLRRTHGIEVQIRVGLNSGDVVVRAIGSDLHMDYSAIGPTTHLAGRVEQLAPPGGIRLTAETFRLVEGFIEVKPLGLVPVKGVTEPVEMFELAGAGPTRTRWQAVAARGLTRFVGRESELNVLQRALSRAEAGHGQIAALVGEAGIGKSRLAWEFAHSSRTDGWLLLESGSVSYGKATAYLPVIDLLRAYFKIQDRDDQRTIRERVTGKLLTLDRSLEAGVPAFLALLDVAPTDPEWLALEPAQRREHTLDIIRRLLLREAARQPLFLVFEDLHWADAETHALLDRLADALGGMRIMLLVNYRPEYRHGWGSKSCYTELRIDPLPPASAGELLQALLGEAVGLDTLKQRLIDRTEGNPFFLEETVRTLVETRVLLGTRGAYRLARPVSSVQVPPTVQAVLAARIDRLGPEEKQLLQSAAVIGKDVPYVLLRAISSEPEEILRSRLASLQRAEFLYEARLFPDLEYTFKHALTHEVAYAGLVHERRRMLHGKVLEALEQVAGDRIAEHAESLARHARQAESWAKAVDYYREAGTKGYGRGSLPESVEQYEQALALVARLPWTPENIRRAVDLRLELHPPLWMLAQTSRLLELHEEAERLARELNDLPRLGRVFNRMGTYSWMNARYAQASAYALQALDIATQTSAPELAISAKYVLGATHYALGEYAAAIELLLGLVEGPDAELARRRRGFTYVLASGWLAWSFSLIGALGRARVYADRAVQAADASGHPQAQAYAHVLRAIPPLYQGDFDSAARWAEPALRLCESRGLRAWLPTAASTSGWALVRAGQVTEGLPLLEQGARLQQDVGQTHLSQYHARWAEGLLLAGRLADAWDVASRARELAVASGERGMEAEALQVLGDIASLEDGVDTDAARAWYEQSSRLAAAIGMRPVVARCHLGLGALYRRLGKRPEAREHLVVALAMLREMDIRVGWDQAENALRDLG
jgi:class 3 adenylate cyclase/tetratricopeptide (TPR) repeat protein